MAEKPFGINISNTARRAAGQGPGQTQLEGSFESEAKTFGANESIDVAGFAYVFAYGGGAVTCHDTPSGAPVALQDRSGAAVTVTTARLIEVRGVRFIRFAATATVVGCG